MAAPIHITDAEFENSVLKSAVPVIVDFWAPWCGPCRQIAPSLEKLAEEYDGKLIVAKVNTDEDPQWSQAYEVSGIPTLLFVAGGKIVFRMVGARPFGYIKQVVEQFLETVAAPAEPAPATTTPAAA
jgi:thioredoxin 1